MLLLASSVCGLFKWRQFEPEVILLAVGWYLRFSLSYRDVEELLAERGCVPIGSVQLTASTKTDRDLREDRDGRKSCRQETAGTTQR